MIQYLIDSRKPLTGHNILYDTLFIYHQFIAELPNSFSTFVAKWQNMFPETFDTRVLAAESFESSTGCKLTRTY